MDIEQFREKKTTLVVCSLTSLASVPELNPKLYKEQQSKREEQIIRRSLTLIWLVVSEIQSQLGVCDTQWQESTKVTTIQYLVDRKYGTRPMKSGRDSSVLVVGWLLERINDILKASILNSALRTHLSGLFWSTTS